MNKTELLKLARQYLIADEGLSEANLIRKIQRAEGHVDCFATGKKHCEHMTCRWRATCLPDAQEQDARGPGAHVSNSTAEAKS